MPPMARCRGGDVAGSNPTQCPASALSRAEALRRSKIRLFPVVCVAQTMVSVNLAKQYLSPWSVAPRTKNRSGLAALFGSVALRPAPNPQSKSISSKNFVIFRNNLGPLDHCALFIRNLE